MNIVITFCMSVSPVIPPAASHVHLTRFAARSRAQFTCAWLEKLDIKKVRDMICNSKPFHQQKERETLVNR